MRSGGDNEDLGRKLRAGSEARPSLTPKVPSSSIAVFLSILLMSWTACSNRERATPADHPRLTPNLVMRDVIFHSAALNRGMQYRVVMPARVSGGAKLPVVYLLHGGGGNFRDWSNYTDVARFAERGLILVMPEGDDSYYTNSAGRPQDRYEDYVVSELISDVEARFPAATGRANRSIVGISMGGFGAVKLALRHPDVYVFAGGLSSAVDVPHRPFSIKRIQQWRQHSAIFGPWGSSTRQDNDPFVLARSADPARTPYLFLTCGEQEGLLPANRSLAALLERRHFAYEFHTTRGGHDWNQWNGWLDDCFQSLRAHASPHR
jgi:putative tributyrin esterase